MEKTLVKDLRLNQNFVKQQGEYDITPDNGPFEKNDLIAAISHELKTPVAAMKMSLCLLADERIGSINQEQSELIKAMKDDSTRLSTIIGELLKFLQLGANKLDLNQRQILPAQIIYEATNAVAILAQQKSIKFIINDIMKSANYKQIRRKRVGY